MMPRERTTSMMTWMSSGQITPNTPGVLRVPAFTQARANNPGQSSSGSNMPKGKPGTAMIGDKAPSSGHNHGPGQECYMCGDDTHWTGDCPHQKKFIVLGWMKMGPDKRYILYDGSRLPSFAAANGRKRKDIIEQWARERKWPGSETYHPDA